VQPDHTDDETIEARNNKTGPHLSSEQDRRDDGEKNKIDSPTGTSPRRASDLYCCPPRVRQFVNQRGALQRETWLATDDKKVS
jgi:hypothetical protein